MTLGSGTGSARPERAGRRSEGPRRPHARNPPALERRDGLGDTVPVTHRSPLSVIRRAIPRSLGVALLLIGVGSAACSGAAETGSGEAPPAQTAKTPEPAPPPVVAAQQPAPPRPTAKERATLAFDASAAKGQAEAFREDLAKGRTAVKAKRYAEGIAAFQSALKIDPNHPSALAELGWAAFLGDELDLAERSTQRALDSSAASDRTRGAALYNLGRILEEKDDKVGATTAYTRSLRLRPNDIVAERLAVLEGEGATAEENECELRRMEGAPPLDLCAAFIAGRSASTADYDSIYCEDRDVTITDAVVDAAGTPMGGERATRIALDLGDGAQVATFSVTRNWTEGGDGSTTYVALLFSDRWYVGELGSEYNPGVGYIGESFVVESVAADDLIAGGRPEVVITSLWSHYDGDYGDNVMESGTETVVVVLSMDGDSPRWLAAVKGSIVAELGAMIEGEPSEVEATRSERRVDIDYLRGSGEIEVKAVSGSEPSAPLGRHELGEGMARCPASLTFMGPG